jgi:hypothetical protein
MTTHDKESQMTITDDDFGDGVAEPTPEPVRGPEADEPAAPGGWFNCTVSMTGPAEDGTVYIRLRELTGTFHRWYSAIPAARKEMLATALTAMSTDREVRALLTTTDQNGVINRLWLR